MIKKDPTGRGFSEIDPVTGDVIRQFEQKVWIEHDPAGNIKALHRIDYSDVWHQHGRVPVAVAEGSPNSITDVTDELKDLPSGVRDDDDLVANRRFIPGDKSFKVK